MDSDLAKQAYDVHAITDDSPPGHGETLTVDECASEKEARERAENHEGVHDVLSVEPHVERIELAVEGTTDAIAEYLEAVDNASVIEGVEVKGRDPDNATVDVENEEGVPTFGVSDWRDVVMRVIGLDDHLGDGDGIDMAADQVAAEDSTVEIVIGEETVARVVCTEQERTGDVRVPGDDQVV